MYRDLYNLYEFGLGQGRLGMKSGKMSILQNKLSGYIAEVISSVNHKTAEKINDRVPMGSAVDFLFH